MLMFGHHYRRVREHPHVVRVHEKSKGCCCTPGGCCSPKYLIIYPIIIIVMTSLACSLSSLPVIGLLFGVLCTALGPLKGMASKVLCCSTCGGSKLVGCCPFI